MVGASNSLISSVMVSLLSSAKCRAVSPSSSSAFTSACADTSSSTTEQWPCKKHQLQTLQTLPSLSISFFTWCQTLVQPSSGLKSFSVIPKGDWVVGEGDLPAKQRVKAASVCGYCGGRRWPGLAWWACPRRRGARSGTPSAARRSRRLSSRPRAAWTSTEASPSLCKKEAVSH